MTKRTSWPYEQYRFTLLGDRNTQKCKQYVVGYTAGSQAEIIQQEVRRKLLTTPPCQSGHHWF